MGNDGSRVVVNGGDSTGPTYEINRKESITRNKSDQRDSIIPPILDEKSLLGSTRQVGE